MATPGAFRVSNSRPVSTSQSLTAAAPKVNNRRPAGLNSNGQNRPASLGSVHFKAGVEGQQLMGDHA